MRLAGRLRAGRLRAGQLRAGLSLIHIYAHSVAAFYRHAFYADIVLVHRHQLDIEALRLAGKVADVDAGQQSGHAVDAVSYTHLKCLHLQAPAPANAGAADNAAARNPGGGA